MLNIEGFGRHALIPSVGAVYDRTIYRAIDRAIYDGTFAAGMVISSANGKPKMSTGFSHK